MAPLSCELDTIVAISTPPGRGGIGIVRLSGTHACAIATPLLRLRHPLADARARFGHLLDLTRSSPHDVLDEVIVTLFAAPNSYTTEDVLEIATHGSPVILEYVVRESIARGARLADPGEFTRRAFLAGRLDLLQAEAIHDLIQSTTLHQARLAASQLTGRLSRQVAPVKSELISIIAKLEAGIDFAEDDVDVLSPQDLIRAIEEVQSPLAVLKESFAYGSLVREGFSVVLVGRPNAGKSSLFNALLKQDRAIVTAQPGTTRDLVSESFSLDGIPVKLIDTAGIRHRTSQSTRVDTSIEEAEALGMAKSREAMAEAHLVVHVIDATLPLHEDDLLMLSEHTVGPLLVALSKSDLLAASSSVVVGRGLAAPYQAASELKAVLGNEAPVASRRTVQISSRTGAGLTELQDAMRSVLTIATPAPEAALLTNLRQQSAVTDSIEALREARSAAARGVPHEVLMIELKAALDALDRLTGATDGDDILNRIFSIFCIGK